MSEQSVVRVGRVTKTFPRGDVTALQDINLELAPREFVSLIGPSGCGKSTLLRCINRLVEPTSGRILLDGVDVTAASGAELRRVRRRIGMIFQQFNLVKRSSVLTNVLSGRLGWVSPMQSLVGHFPPQDYQRAFANLERVGIPEKAFVRGDVRCCGLGHRCSPVGVGGGLRRPPPTVS